MASRALAPARAPPLRRRERQWAGLGRAADGVGGEAGWGGVRCYGLAAGETDQRRAAERRSPRSPHPAAFGARKNAAPGFPIPTFPIPLPMNLRTRTACPSTGMNLRPRPRPRPRSPSFVLFLRPWRLRTPLPSRPFRSFARLAPCCRTLFLACPPLRCCSSCLPESWPSLPLPLHAVRTRRAHPMAGNCSCAPSGERRTRVVWRPWSWSWSSSIHDVTGTENPSLLATATRRDTRGLYAVYVYANDYILCRL